ncbi:hypothetical protein INT48_007587 [Thamnidium elegans]|uniref:Uncharacterized protein n=1 Tax=Thamnidium elegans TaxID=101142 RepID=A0A8H7SRH6_9FUNG|nr:hypothetical protein INT48_007587 [Thamnidium elegans]
MTEATHSITKKKVSAETIANTFKPTSMSEELDLMPVKLMLEINVGEVVEINALKLSLSKIFNLINLSCLNIFKKYIKDELFWEEVNGCNVELLPSISDILVNKVNRIIQINKDENDQLVFKKLRLHITKEKAVSIEEDNDYMTVLLDILEIVVRNCIADNTPKTNDHDSEMTFYKKVASILDILLKNSNVDMLE